MSVAYNTNTAYDYRRYSERQETERPAVAVRPAQRSGVMARRAVMMIAAVFVAAVCIGLVYMKAQVYMAQRDINTIRNEIKVAERANSNLSEQYSEATNISTIMEKATTLGMGYPSGDQILYVSLTGTNKTEMKK
jgi:cell division protein FtsL